MVLSPGNAAHEESRPDQATSQQRVQNPVSTCHRMGKKRHAPRDRENRFVDTAERSHCDACRKHNQHIHARQEDGEAAGTRRGHIGQYRSAMLHWVHVPGKASSINNSENTGWTPPYIQEANDRSSRYKRQLLMQTLISYVDTVEMQQEPDSTLPGSSLSNSNGTARRPANGTETRRKRLDDNKNEEIHKHHVRDYKKRRRDRNSNMQPVTCSSSDAAMETATNLQMDTSYSRR